MTKARAFTIAGLVHLAVATLLAMTFLAGQPGTALGSGMVITRTPTPTPPNGNGNKCKLTCTKTADPTCDSVTFTIWVCNRGDRECKDVVGSDDLPDELELVSPTDTEFNFGDLDPGCLDPFTIVARVPGGVGVDTQFTNEFTVRETGGKGVTCPVTLPLPECGGNVAQSGKVAPQAVVVGLLAMGAGLLAAGLVLRAKNRAQ